MKTINYIKHLFAVLLILAIACPFEGLSQRTQERTNSRPEFIPGTVAIKVKEGVGPFQIKEGAVKFGISSLDKMVTKYNFTKLENRFKHKPISRSSGLPDLSRIYRIEFSASLNVHQIANELADNPNIEYAEPISYGRFTEFPDDSFYGSQQHLPQIMAEEAWNIHQGEDGDEVVIAIVDSGTDWLHPDLTENCWQNLGEDADGDGVTLEFNNGVWERDPDDLNDIDDDGNGYVDDVIGWDFHEQQSMGNGSNPDPLWNQPGYAHGTLCTGIAAGRTNNGVGISSVSWNVKYMPVQSGDGNGSVSYGIDAVIYAAENGADIISCSWGTGHAYSQSDNEAMQYAIGLGSILCFAAGNANTNNVYFPAGYPGVISVAAVNDDDHRASFSSFGGAIDIAAPGVNILSTIPSNGYVGGSGTSFSAPMVAGLLGLLKSYNPDWTNDQLIKQLIGTADNIDDLNPGFEYALGSGRINAYHALVDENVELPQELKVEILDLIFEDEDGNGVIEAGETVSVSLTLRNYALYDSSENTSITLSSFDPDVTITTGTTATSLPADGLIELINVFEFIVDETASSHMADLLIEVTAELPIVYGSETEFSIPVAPSGFFVWEGDPDSPDYSGEFIYDFLQEKGYPVMYSNTFPGSFDGFDAVFLSFGFWDGGGIPLSDDKAIVVIEYLENGGNVYLEGGDALGWDQPDNAQLLDLFGLVSGEDGTTNPIKNLSGQANSLTHDMVFTGSSQTSYTWIDIFTPSDNGVAAFVESDYGIVAVQNSIPDGHRTFCFSYALSYLDDENPRSSRYTFMIQLLNFFGYPQGEIVANFIADKKDVKPDHEVQFTDWSITEDDVEIISYAWDFDEDGAFDSYDQNPVWTYSEGGVYDVSLIIFGDGGQSDTIVKKDMIAVRSGILVYEGKENSNGYSGTFIHEYLLDHYYEEVGYTNNLPLSLEGYEAVFLSFGNTGSMGTSPTTSMLNTIYNYAASGGMVYIEGGDAINTFNSSDIWVFGLSDSEKGTKNTLTDLVGQSNAITNGLQFNATNQMSVRSIDTYTIYDGISGVSEAFYESSYGLVAVQFDGSDAGGQKTFCMSYALADLEDGEGLNTRKELLSRILNFFDVVADVSENELNLKNHLRVYPNPAQNHITLQLYAEESGNVEVEVFDLSGRIVSSINKNLPEGEHNFDFNISAFNSGVYYLRLRSGNQSETIKWIKVE